LSEKPLHILFLPKWYPNEYDIFDGNFIENHAHSVKLVAQVSVIFVHSESKSENTYRLTQQNNQGINEIRVFFKKATSKIGVWNKVVTLFRYFQAQQLAYKQLLKTHGAPNLSHVHVLTRSALLAIHLKMKQNIPFVITEHWSGYLKANGLYKGFLKKMGTELVVKQASGITTVSSQLKEAMQGHRLLGEYTVIPNVVDTKVFVPIETNHSRTEILFVGNLLQMPKRILDIIRSMNVLKQHYSNFHLSIVGEGVDEKACQELINELSLNQEVTLKGTLNRAEVAKTMGESDFLILFSYFENQPCVINEALSCGIPILVPDIPGIAERMNEELGIMIPTGDLEAFDAALLKMCNSHGKYSKQSIRAFAEQEYSEQSIGQQFLTVYQNALKHG